VARGHVDEEGTEVAHSPAMTGGALREVVDEDARGELPMVARGHDDEAVLGLVVVVVQAPGAATCVLVQGDEGGRGEDCDGGSVYRL